jgi:hypothetical protein
LKNRGQNRRNGKTAAGWAKVNGINFFPAEFASWVQPVLDRAFFAHTPIKIAAFGRDGSKSWGIAINLRRSLLFHHLQRHCS